jgi:hypothetical protein
MIFISLILLSDIKTFRNAVISNGDFRGINCRDNVGVVRGQCLMYTIIVS